jgi:hypothetical protein
MQQRIVYNATPNGYAAGMWESGMGMAADGEGNLYVVTGNGTVGDGSDPTSLTNRGESALKLTPSGSTLRVASYFTPYNYQFANDYDLDYGAMGALLIPNSSYFVTGAKEGIIYLLNKDAMGGYLPASNAVQQAVTLGVNANMHCQPAYYKGSASEIVYVWSENDPLRGIPFDRATNTLASQSQVTSGVAGPTGQNGAILSVSSNGSQDGTGILWASYASTGDAEHGVRPGILRAFDASQISRELWNSQQTAGDGSGTYAKLAAPTPEGRFVATVINMYGREVGFYTELSPRTPIAHPECYFAAHDPETQDTVLLMEDVSGRGAPLDQIAGVAAADAAPAIRTLAQLHAAFWDDGSLQDAVDAEYGDGVVIVASALREID